MSNLDLRTPDLHDFSDLHVSLRRVKPTMAFVVMLIAFILGDIALHPTQAALTEAVQQQVLVYG